ncbi:hypothetical protein [Spirosoma jeollabukense]
MNTSTGMQPPESIHFHYAEKNANVVGDIATYQAHLTKLFID